MSNVFTGYALDPTVGMSSNEGGTYIGNVESAESTSGRTVFENPNKPDISKAGEAKRRKLEKNDNSGDVEGYKGPWAPYENESRSAKPNEVQSSHLILQVEQILYLHCIGQIFENH